MKSRPLAVCSLFHFPWTHAPRGLPGVLPFGVRTFLTLRPRPPPWAEASARGARSPGKLGSCTKRQVERLVHQSVRTPVVVARNGFESHHAHACDCAPGLGVQRLEPIVLHLVLA